jgi:hypothetical protein
MLFLFFLANQALRKLLMDHPAETGDVEELLHITSFLSATLELQG